MLVLETRAGTRIAFALAVSLSAVLVGCGDAGSGDSFSEADRAKVEQQSKELEQSASTLGADLGQCVQDAVGSLIGGGETDLGKCVEKNLQERADLAKSTDDLIRAVVPKASGECASSLTQLGNAVSSLRTSAEKVARSLNDGFDATDAQGIGTEVSKIAAAVQSDWDKVRSSCGG